MNGYGLAYLAGVVDSDGTIGIRKSTYAMRVTKDSRQPIYSERVCVRQVEPDAVELLHATFGGYRYTAKAYCRGGKPLNGWEVTNQKAVHAIQRLLPHLRIKKKQAENCLALRALKSISKKVRVRPARGHVGSAPRPKMLSAKMEMLCVRAHELNRVGV